MSQPSPELHNKRRPLWPWIVGAALLCLFAAGFSFWWPMYRIQQLVKYAWENEGSARINHDHPAWMKWFVVEDAYLPYFDELIFFVCVDNSITDEQLRSLPMCEDLRTVMLDISKCSSDNVPPLENCQKLERIILIGRDEPIPVQWMSGFSQLDECKLLNILVPPDQWCVLIDLPNMTSLEISDRMAHVTRTSVTERYLSIERNHLTQTEAEGITAVPDLKRLTLEYSTSTPEFWETLSQHQNLESLTILPRSSSSTLRLTSTELDHIQEISSLTELHTALGSNRSVEFETEARERLLRQRPDVLWHK